PQALPLGEQGSSALEAHVGRLGERALEALERLLRASLGGREEPTAAGRDRGGPRVPAGRGALLEPARQPVGLVPAPSRKESFDHVAVTPVPAVLVGAGPITERRRLR